MVSAAPRKKKSGEKLIDNLAYQIAIQVRVPALAEGGTGVAKSQLAAAMAKAMGFKFYPLIGSCHAPEDFGGIPFPVFEQGHAELLPMKWVRQTTDPYWFIFVDEVTTIPQSVRPPMLSLLSERRIGEIEMHPTAIICGACNPPALAPNAAPLEVSLNNRFYHHNWKTPIDSWLEGMKNDQNFPAPEVRILPDNWVTYRGKWSGLMASFVQSKRSMAEYEYKPEDTVKAFYTLRSIQKAALLMAGAESIDAPAEVCNELLTGIVGNEWASEFLTYCNAVELYDPEEIVEGKAKVKWDKRRFDVISCLPSAVLGAVRNNNNADRFGRACEFFVELCEHEADLAVYPLSELMQIKPKDYRFSVEVATTFCDVLDQLKGV